MSIRVIGDGSGGYRLLSAKEFVSGWSRGRVVGVGGFHEEDDAIDAAVRTYVVLGAWLAHQRLPPLPSFECEPARIIHDGAYRWILIGRTPIARLIDDASNADRSGSAFEIVLHGPISEGMAIHAALIAVRAAAGKITADDVRPALNVARRNGPTVYVRSG